MRVLTDDAVQSTRVSDISHSKVNHAYYCDFITNDFHFWSSVVFQSDYAGKTSAIEYIPRIGQAVNGQSEMPYLDHD